MTAPTTARSWPIDSTVDPARPVVAVRWSAWHDTPPAPGDLVRFLGGVTGVVATVERDEVTVGLVRDAERKAALRAAVVLDVCDVDTHSLVVHLLGQPALDGQDVTVESAAGVRYTGTLASVIVDGGLEQIRMLVVRDDSGDRRIPWSKVVAVHTPSWDPEP